MPHFPERMKKKRTRIKLFVPKKRRQRDMVRRPKPTDDFFSPVRDEGGKREERE